MREIDLSPTRRLWSTTNAAANSAPPSKNSQKRGGGQPACSSNCVGIIQQQHHPRRSKTRSGSGRAPGLSSRMSALDRERQEKIDRENRILLRKILEQHHGIRRHSSIPPSAGSYRNQIYYFSINLR